MAVAAEDTAGVEVGTEDGALAEVLEVVVGMTGTEVELLLLLLLLRVSSTDVEEEDGAEGAEVG